MRLDEHLRTLSAHIWTVREAKSKLSEVLKLARDEGPQRIGAREPYVVITEAEWQRLNAPKPHLGKWLLENMPQTDELELPSRKDRDRPVLFGDGDA